MATAWWIDSGIHKKMLRDTIYEAVKDGDIERPYPTIRSDEPLTLRHIVTSFIVFGIGIILAGIAVWIPCTRARYYYSLKLLTGPLLLLLLKPPSFFIPHIHHLTV